MRRAAGLLLSLLVAGSVATGAAPAAGGLERTASQGAQEPPPAGQEDLGSAIAPMEEQQFTFTESRAMLPFTIENQLDRPLDVVVVLESAKLEFPQGSEMRVTLPPGATGLEVALESRASGSFPLELKVLTADGTSELASTRYTVRSTAISGIGLLLSVSAGLFLLMWWAKHFHGVRRDRRLVSPNHPTVHLGEPGPPEEGDGSGRAGSGGAPS